MDNQPPTTPNSPPPIQNPSSNVPQVQASPVVTSSSGHKSKIIMVIVVLSAVLIALAAGGVYYYLNMLPNKTPGSVVTPPTTQLTPTNSPSPEDELNAISVSVVDFSAVDKDLQSL